MKGNLSGKRAIVTGGTRGIGAEIARQLAVEGAAVLATARKPADDLPPGVLFTTADVTVPEDAARLAWHAAEVLGGVDILVDNAGSGTLRPDGLLGTDDAAWWHTLEVNLLGAVRLDRAVLPGMIERGHGVIVHISSAAAHEPGPGVVDYSAAKAALSSYSKGLANEMAGKGIRVNRVSPGVTLTAKVETGIAKLAAAQGTDFETALQRWGEGLGGIPIGRPGTPADIAALVVFLCSDQSAWITGSDFVIDGGMLKAN
ncbi:oxidoreductase [Amycolatopsis nigrescens]|uniref:oxidoreductase n=1 Tax=Amycolatopsis nigrescens TaxID=381445 RepID=UPI000378DC93|nr:oxidoreductase [Amycolatopsis nigrescens]